MSCVCSMKPGQLHSEAQTVATATHGGKIDPGPARAAELLNAIIQGTATATGTQFFRSLVKHLAEGLHVRFAFVAECLPNLRARSLAFFQNNDFGQDFDYALPGPPCMKVAEGRVCHVPDRLAEEFPEDKGMIDLGTVSYLGVPLRGSDGTVIGHLVT